MNPQNRMIGRDGAEPVNTVRVRKGDSPMEKQREPKRPAKRLTLAEKKAVRDAG